MSDNLAPGMLACSRYELFLPNMPAISIAVTLEDMAQESLGARFARSSGATRYGLMCLKAVDSPMYSVVWILREGKLVLASSRGDSHLSDELTRVLVRLLGVFFHEIREIVPELAVLNCSATNESILS